jgi:hypothetical protein
VLGLTVLAQRWRPGRGVVLGLALVAGVTWLRVATRGLTGEADPGWDALWGRGFWSAVPRLPAMVIQWLATPWTELQVIRRPQSTPPGFATDPTWLLLLFYGVWWAVLGAGVWTWRRLCPRFQVHGRSAP